MCSAVAHQPELHCTLYYTEAAHCSDSTRWQNCQGKIPIKASFMLPALTNIWCSTAAASLDQIVPVLLATQVPHTCREPAEVLR